MSSVKSTGSTYSGGANGASEGDPSSSMVPETEKKGEILKCGHLRKLKGSDGRNILLAQTVKRKYFVLRGETENSPAQLEYYDSEKKCKVGQPPKRSIALKTCFNINRKVDKKQKHVIALYTKDDCFSMVFETEKELEDWLAALLALQHGEDTLEGEAPKPAFEHVWQVTVKQKGLGSSKNILGPYRLCLTSKALSLVKMSQEDVPSVLEFPLMSIRRCGHSDCFFFMELGRSAITGSGELWMQTEDTMIAQNMHGAILSAMRNSAKDDAGPRPRTWSSSTSNNEASKPITVVGRRPTASAMPPSLCKSLPSSTSSALSSRAPVLLPTARTSRRRHSVSGATTNRERADSMPSRSRTISEGHSHPHPQHGPQQCRQAPGQGGPPHLMPVSSVSRPHSMYSRAVSYSPPVPTTTSLRDTMCMSFSPSSVAYSTDSAGSSMSIDEVEMDMGVHHAAVATPDSLPMEPPILEESLDEYVPWQGSNDMVDERDNSSYMPMGRSSGSLTLLLNQGQSRNLSKYSPGQGFTSGSPSQGSYMEMLSPCGTSPPDPPGGYIPMSPGAGPSSSDPLLKTALCGKGGPGIRTPLLPSSANHSRTSSLAEETTPDGYVPMAPGGVDSGYAEMEPGRGIHPHSLDEFQVGMSPASSCSVTSGTPSTDMKFSEYHLEKVCSYFTPSEDEGVLLERPVRAYSVGSRPEGVKRKSSKLEVAQENFRVRAFSLGSRLGIKFGGSSGSGSSSSSSGCGAGGSKPSSSFSETSQQGVLSKPPSSCSSSEPQPTPPQYSGSSATSRAGKKCASAPILATSPPIVSSWSGAPGSYLRTFFGSKETAAAMAVSPPRHQSAGASDLMEMDFSKKRNSSASSLGSERERKGSKSTGVRSALARSFRVDSFRKKKNSMPAAATPPNSAGGSNHEAEDDYIMMVGGHRDHNQENYQEHTVNKNLPSNDYMLMGRVGKGDSQVQEDNTPYMLMGRVGKGDSQVQEDNTPYMLMAGSSSNKTLLPPPPWGSQQLPQNNSNKKDTGRALPPPGYVDMSCGGKERKKDLAIAQVPQLTSPESEEYMLLDVGAYPSPAVTPTNTNTSPSSTLSNSEYVSMVAGTTRWKERQGSLGSLKSLSYGVSSPRNIPTSQPISIRVNERTSSEDFPEGPLAEEEASSSLRPSPVPSTANSSKLPGPFGSLSGILSRKGGGGSGTPPKSPNSSPFSSLRRKPSTKTTSVLLGDSSSDKLARSLEGLRIAGSSPGAPRGDVPVVTNTRSVSPSSASSSVAAVGRGSSSWSIASGGSGDTSSSPSNTSLLSVVDALTPTSTSATHDYVNMAAMQSRPKISPKPEAPSETVPLSVRLGLKSVSSFSQKRVPDNNMDSILKPGTPPTYENLSFPSSSSSSSSGRAVDKELNYASLDLPGEESGHVGAGFGGGPKSPKVSDATELQQVEEEDDGGGRRRLSYAQIDFTKSEGMRKTPHSLLRDPRQ